MSNFPAKFRVYDEKSDEIFVAEATALQGDGEYISLGCREVRHGPRDHEIIPSYGEIQEEGLTFSWFTGWTDRNGDEIFEGDVLKRAKDRVAENERKWLEENKDAPDVDDVESFVEDKSGSLGLVEWKAGGFTIRILEGHKWAFIGPEGTVEVSLDEEVEVVGNKWQNQKLL